jgi:hypothetical protein
VASQAVIIKQIEKVVAGKYFDWMIGLTDNPLNRKAELGNPLSFLQWKADSEQDAKNVELHFLLKGMQSVGIAPNLAIHVYILLVQNS